MRLANSAQGAGWMFYFHVAEIEAAIERVRRNGGRLVHGPAVVPGGQQIAYCIDTQGAAFGMVGPGTQMATSYKTLANNPDIPRLKI